MGDKKFYGDGEDCSKFLPTTKVMKQRTKTGQFSWGSSSHNCSFTLHPILICNKLPIILSLLIWGFENSQGGKQHWLPPLTHEASSKLPQLSAGWTGHTWAVSCPHTAADKSRNGSSLKALLVIRATEPTTSRANQAKTLHWMYQIG